MQSSANSRGVPVLVNPGLQALVTLTDPSSLPPPQPENWSEIEQLMGELQSVSHYAVHKGAARLLTFYQVKPRHGQPSLPRRNPDVPLPDHLYFPLQRAYKRLDRITGEI